MKNIAIALCLIGILILVGCGNEGQTVSVAKQEQEGKLITVKEQSVEIQKPTSTPTSVPPPKDEDEEDLSNKELIEKLSEEKGLSEDEDDNVQPPDAETILLLNFKGVPSYLEIEAGTTITWENRDVYGHVVAIFKLTQGPMLAKGDTWDYTFNNPGNYTWMSAGHPKTNGQIIVI